MSYITGLINYSATDYSQSTTTNTLSFIPNKLYSGYIINTGPYNMTIQILFIDENDTINQLDPIEIKFFNKFNFKNLKLYQIIITLANTPSYYSYNIFGINYSEKAIPEFSFERYYAETIHGEIWADIGFEPQQLMAIPLSEDVTVGTSAVQIDTTTPKNVPEVILKADSSNSAVIKIGSSSSQTYPLAAGQELHLHFVCPTYIYAISTAAGQILHVIYVY
ncbi:MAG: hypothetical protein QW246_05665 [Thermoplasmata archaeon]